MDRKKKIELLKGIAEGQASILDLQGHVLIVQKDGKNYLAEGGLIGREIEDSELEQVKAPVIYIDEEDLRA